LDAAYLEKKTENQKKENITTNLDRGLNFGNNK